MKYDEKEEGFESGLSLEEGDDIDKYFQVEGGTEREERVSLTDTKEM